MTDSQPSRLDQIESNLDRLANLLTQTASRTIDNENSIARLTEVYTSDRQQLQNAVEALIEAQRNQQETIAYMLGVQQSHQTYIEQTLARVEQAVVRIDNVQNEIRGIQAEIRGLQTENRRLLDRLFREDDNES